IRMRYVVQVNFKYK
ncbi:hypothetical protein AB3S75_021841, partial [Citrus x aurantiifolia]